MNEHHEALIQEVALKHGILLGKDDPILIMQTLNAHLMAENSQQQEALLQHFKEQMEETALRWEMNAKDNAEKFLNASLNVSKNTMAKLLQDNAIETVGAIKQEVNQSLHQIKQLLHQTRKTALLNLIASCTVLVSASIFLLDFFLH